MEQEILELLPLHVCETSWHGGLSRTRRVLLFIGKLVEKEKGSKVLVERPEIDSI